MATMNLGQVRDKITEIRRVSESETTTTYNVITECSPDGAGTFVVRNGRDGKSSMLWSDLISGKQNLIDKVNEVGRANVIAIFAINYADISQNNLSETQISFTRDSIASDTVTNIRLYFPNSNEITDFSQYNFYVVYFAQPEIDARFETQTSVVVETNADSFAGDLSEIIDYLIDESIDLVNGRVAYCASARGEVTVVSFHYEEHTGTSVIGYIKSYRDAESYFFTANNPLEDYVDDSGWTITKIPNVTYLGSENSEGEALELAYVYLNNGANEFPGLGKDGKIVVNTSGTTFYIEAYNQATKEFIGYVNDTDSPACYQFCAKRETADTYAITMSPKMIICEAGNIQDGLHELSDKLTDLIAVNNADCLTQGYIGLCKISGSVPLPGGGHRNIRGQIIVTGYENKINSNMIGTISIDEGSNGARTYGFTASYDSDNDTYIIKEMGAKTYRHLLSFSYSGTTYEWEIINGSNESLSISSNDITWDSVNSRIEITLDSSHIKYKDQFLRMRFNYNSVMAYVLSNTGTISYSPSKIMLQVLVLQSDRTNWHAVDLTPMASSGLTDTVTEIALS